MCADGAARRAAPRSGAAGAGREGERDTPPGPRSPKGPGLRVRARALPQRGTGGGLRARELRAASAPGRHKGSQSRPGDWERLLEPVWGKLGARLWPFPRRSCGRTGSCVRGDRAGAAAPLCPSGRPPRLGRSGHFPSSPCHGMSEGIAASLPQKQTPRQLRSVCAIERSRRGASGHHLSCHSGRRRYISLDRSAVLPGQPCQAPVRGENLSRAAAVGSLSAAAPVLTGPSLELPADQCPRGTRGWRERGMPNVPAKHGKGGRMEGGAGPEELWAAQEGRGGLWSGGRAVGPAPLPTRQGRDSRGALCPGGTAEPPQPPVSRRLLSRWPALTQSPSHTLHPYQSTAFFPPSRLPPPPSNSDLFSFCSSLAFKIRARSRKACPAASCTSTRYRVDIFPSLPKKK